MPSARAALSITAPATYELPSDAVGEAIVNAIAHRDYNSQASVEVRLFSDRLEVWNPGTLPGTLTLEDLRHDHPSVPNNPLIAESLFLTRYIEKAGSGTQRMIDFCREAGLPAPDFGQRQGSFVLTLWRDWLTGEALAELQLNERQTLALGFLKAHRRISNPEYQKLTKTTKKTATRDLGDLREKGVVEQRGDRGPGVHYMLAGKRDKKGDNGDMTSPSAEWGHNGDNGDICPYHENLGAARRAGAVARYAKDETFDDGGSPEPAAAWIADCGRMGGSGGGRWKP